MLSSYGWAVAFEAMAGKCCDLKRQRDEAIAKLAAMEKSITDLSHPTIAEVLAQLHQSRASIAAVKGEK